MRKTDGVVKLLQQYLLNVVSMTTSATRDSPNGLSWASLVKKVHEEITKKIQQESPALLTDTSAEAIKFLPHTLSSYELVERWLQVCI